MDILTYGLLNKKVEEAKNVSGEKITEAVNTYLDENPPTTGATAEQAAQIDKNVADIGELKSDLSVIGKCKNLLNTTLQTTTINDVTCTNNGDGTYTLNGTASGYATFEINKTIMSILKDDVSYKLVGLPAGVKGCNLQAYYSTIPIVDRGNGVVSTGSNFKNGTRSIAILITKGTTCNNILIKPMLTTDLNATYDDFVPYTGEGDTLTADVASLKSDLNTLNEGGLLLKDDVINKKIASELAAHPEWTTTVQDKSLTINKMVIGTLGYVTPQMFGAVGDGIHDDTNAIQSALDSAYHVVIPKGTYKISMNNERFYIHNARKWYIGLEIQNNALYFEDCTLQLEGWNTNFYFFLFLNNARNSSISGKVTIIGDKNTHTDEGVFNGEGHCIGIMNGKNISIRDAIIKDAWGDGIWIMNNGEDDCSKGIFPEYITIDNVICDGNRRNGLAICCGKHITVSNSEFNNCTGTNPRTGIDIESNGDGYCLQNIIISNVKSKGCFYGGFGTVMKTDGDSVYWNNAISDGSFYLRIENGCDKGKFVANDIVCGDVVENQDNLVVDVTGTNCFVNIDNVSLKPHKGRACISGQNPSDTTIINISNVYCDASNLKSTDPRSSLFFALGNVVNNLNISNAKMFDGGIYKLLFNSGSESGFDNCNIEVDCKDTEINRDDYSNMFSSTNHKNILKYNNTKIKIISSTQIRGAYTTYIADDTVSEDIFLRWIPQGTKYIIANTSSNVVNVVTQPTQIKVNGVVARNYISIPAGSLAEIWYEKSTNLCYGCLY